MGNTFQFRVFLERTIRSIWKDEKIQRRTIRMCILIPLVLTVLLICIHQLLYADIITVPYVFLFSIVLVSACYGGGRAALSATLITFLAALSYQFMGVVPDWLTMFLYLITGLFLTSLLHFFVQQRRMQEILIGKTNETNAELTRLEKNHEDFVNMASHELKLPVTVLKAYIQMIILKKRRPDFIESYLSIAEKMDIQLDKLLNIISDLQDATKISSGSLNCLMNDFNLNNSIRNSIDGVLIANPDIVIDYDLAEPDPVIKGDKERIEQVISNFISNSLKYSGTEKYIKLSSSCKDGFIKVAVTDHGYGIPPVNQPHVFERFYRVGSQQVKKLPGMGLGLFICKEIINKHHGEIGVISEEGKGSEFWFSLPLKPLNL